MPCPTTPGEEFSLVAFAREIGTGSIGDVGLGYPVHRVVAWIDPRHRRDRAEFAECRVGNVAVVDHVRIVREQHFEELSACADFRIGAEYAGPDVGAVVISGSVESAFLPMKRCKWSMRVEQSADCGCGPCLYDLDDRRMTSRWY